MSSMGRYDYSSPAEPMNGARLTPGLMEQIEICHKEIGLLFEAVHGLAEHVGPICQPAPPAVGEGKNVQVAPGPEPAPAVIEMLRLQERIASLNFMVRALIPRISI